VKRIIWLALVMALSVAACSQTGGPNPTTTTTMSDASTTTTTGEGVTTTASSPETTVPTEADHEMTIAGFAFSGPATVGVGETILVTNEDSFSHTWTSSEGGWQSGSLGRGRSFFYTFEEAGTFAFFCGIHSEMRGTITVEG